MKQEHQYVGNASACKGESFIQRSIGPSFMKRGAGFMHSIHKLIISHVFLCEADIFFLQQPAVTKTDYKRNVFKPKLQSTINNDRFPLFKVKSWPEIHFVPSAPVKKDVGGLVPMPVRTVAWVNLISAAPAKPELHPQTHPFVMEKERLKACDLILPLKPLRACVIIRSAENICNFPSFVMFTLSKWTLICCN